MNKIKKSRHTLIMKYPSTWWHDNWREGLVSGNGIVGANVYGGTKTETVMLNHGMLWHAGRQDELPDVSECLAKTRQEMDLGNFKEASWILTNALKDKEYKTNLSKPFSMADFKSTITPKLGFEKFLRAVNMKTGEVSSQWYDADTFYRRDLFVSRADDVVVYRTTATNTSMEIKFELGIHKSFKKPAPDCCKQLEDNKKLNVSDGYMYFSGLNDNGQEYGLVIKIIAPNANIISEEESIKVSNCNNVLVLAKLFVNEASDTKFEQLKGELDALSENYDYLLSRHKAIHEKLYNSASLKLGKVKNKSNEELLLEAYNKETSPELIEKMWRFGRYLFISGTDEKAYPFPLYGLWGGDYKLMWSHNMANENTQMIYWHSNVGNLVQFNKALFEYYNSKLPQFRLNAKNLFGCNGIYMTAGTTPDVSAPNQVVPVIMNWVGAAAWIAQHYYSHYLYTKDITFLKETALPFMAEVANFYEDYITFYEDGSIKLYPSVSPENTPSNFMPPANVHMAHPMPTTINSTIDLALVKELFTNMLAINDEHQLFEDKKSVWEKIIASIPEYKVNSEGAMREWQNEMFEDRYDHRHLSHIYPVFPGYEINSENNPELFKACEKAVELRKIDAQTGWSLAHMACIYARFNRGNDAMKCLNNMAKASIINNLFTLHNDWRAMNISLDMDPSPVQLDANLGYVNAIQEMLIYSSKSLVKLLPALPDVMYKGKVKDFRFCAGTVSLQWNTKQNVFKAELKAEQATMIELKLPNEFKNYQFETNNAELLKQEENRLTIKFNPASSIIITV
jgi:alpha-L-fucosidase 2